MISDSSELGVWYAMGVPIQILAKFVTNVKNEFISDIYIETNSLLQDRCNQMLQSNVEFKKKIVDSQKDFKRQR